MAHAPWAYAGKRSSLLSEQGLLRNMKKPRMEFCEHYVYEKAHKVKFSTSKHKSRECCYTMRLQMFRVRLKLLPRVVQGTLLLLLMIISIYAWIYFFKHKNEVFDIFKLWRAMVENRIGRMLKTVRSDNETKYIEKAFKDICNRNQ